MKQFTCIDLFCGAGGSTLGAKLAGCKVIAAYDLNSTHLKSYRANYPDVPTYCADVLELEASELPEGADILMGSTPCESFSRINMHGRICDMALTDKFLELVADYKPKYWVLENVPEIAKYLKERDVPYRMLCAADYGVPQRRKRCMAGNYPEPIMTHRHGDIRWHTKFGQIRDTDRSNHSILSRKAIQGMYERIWEMGKKGHGFKVKIVDDDIVLNTITSSESHGVRAGSQIVWDKGTLRRLTLLECQRAQSFPDNYVFCGDLSAKYKQIGQALPPLLMKAILEGIKEAGRSIP